jgi:hypothetical protein
MPPTHADAESKGFALVRTTFRQSGDGVQAVASSACCRASCEAPWLGAGGCSPRIQRFGCLIPLYAALASGHSNGAAHRPKLFGSRSQPSVEHSRWSWHLPSAQRTLQLQVRTWKTAGRVARLC